MKKGIKFATYVGKTKVNIGKIKTIQPLIPNQQDIVEHMKAQSETKDKFKAIYVEVEEQKLQEINSELQSVACSNLGLNRIIIYAESATSNKTIAILIIGLKK